MNLYLTKFQQRNAATGNWVTGMGTEVIFGLKNAGFASEIIEIPGNSWLVPNFLSYTGRIQHAWGFSCPWSVWLRWSPRAELALKNILQIFFGLPKEPFAVLILWLNRSKSDIFAFKPSIFVYQAQMWKWGHQSSISQIQSVVFGQRFFDIIHKKKHKGKCFFLWIFNVNFCITMCIDWGFLAVKKLLFPSLLPEEV